MIYNGVDTDVFQHFLDELSATVPLDAKKRYLIVDNASWHKAARLCWHQFTPMFLPPYSPDFNPIERLWLRLKADYLARTKLRAELGFFGALHTWSRQLIYHPHVHHVVPALGLSENGSLIAPPNPAFLLRVEVLSARFRSRFRRSLQNHPELSARVPPRVWRTAWVVYSLPVGSGKAVLAYLSRYIYRTALSSERALTEKDDFISFRYRDSKTRQIRWAGLPVFEFLARFLQHVLPKNLRRVRAYG